MDQVSKKPADTSIEVFDKGGNISPRLGIDGTNVILGPSGEPIWNTANAMLMLELHEDWEGVLYYNEFRREVELRRPIIGSRHPKSEFPRDMEARDIVAGTVWFNRNGFKKASKEIVRDVMVAYAERFVINPARDWMNSLEWDGAARLDTWTSDYLGVEPDEYVRLVGRSILVSAVARVLDPGCKVDTMAVLEGKQGLKKSTMIEALCPYKEWFGDQLPPLSGNPKEASQYLPGHLIVEFAELDALRKAENERIKAFMTRKIEDYRRPFKPGYKKEPRSCIFMGTTNKDNYLKDPTGNRRYLPLKCVGSLDEDGLIEVRDQLWAEAVHAYKNGEQWWLPKHMVAVAEKVQAERMEVDPWLEKITEELHEKSEVAPSEILNTVLHFTTDKMDRKSVNRVTDCLNQLGWERDGQFTSGPHKGRARYVKK